MARRYSQVLIIGAGIAGCSAALQLAEAGFHVAMCVGGPKMDGG
ncbi:MAG: FAD-dependent oxidoreductase, partial [Deltaproteobacteria bacterium]|nr:FAD-dependent oxidoreductase [Deltaproteobacteria bacterium]